MANNKCNKCIVFDFDCTLTYTHYYWFCKDMLDNKDDKKNYIEDWGDILTKYNLDWDTLKKNNILKNWITNKDILTNIIFGGSERLQEIHDMFKILKKYNYDIIISSKGFYNQIIQVLNFFRLSEYITEINGNRYNDHALLYDIPCIEMSKDDYLYGLINKGYTDITYIDDDNSEHNKLFHNTNFSSLVNYTYYGENIGLHKNKNGLTKEMIAIYNRYGYKRQVVFL